jgi:metallo-beta-lactamase family protein
MKLSFLGAAGCVTGSKYLVEHEGTKVLVDCGLFQGYKNLRLLNWDPLPFNAAKLNAVVLSHAHLDHSGALPLLMRHGFRGPIYATPATTELCGLLLPDSGHLQEDDARFANRHKTSRHSPALPLYTEEDARAVLRLFKPLKVDRTISVGSLKIKFRSSGHILGASSIELSTENGSIFFSGDVGRPDDLIIKAPVPIQHADYLVIESTYGDRLHDPNDNGGTLADVITRTAARGGMVLVPSFAVGRAQNLLYEIHLLKQAGQIPDLPVFLDSPMAIDSLHIYTKYRNEHRLSIEQCKGMSVVSKICRTVDESRALDQLRYPAIIISASGMATGGRILHHLRAMASDHRNSVVFAGYQAAGTRGAKMLAGDRTVRIFGEDIPINADVVSLPSMSAHADAEQLITWMQTLKKIPKHVFVTHGEPASADALRLRISRELGWDVSVPLLGQRVEISGL